MNRINNNVRNYLLTIKEPTELDDVLKLCLQHVQKYEPALLLTPKQLKLHKLVLEMGLKVDGPLKEFVIMITPTVQNCYRKLLNLLEWIKIPTLVVVVIDHNTLMAFKENEKNTTTTVDVGASTANSKHFVDKQASAHSDPKSLKNFVVEDHADDSILADDVYIPDSDEGATDDSSDSDFDKGSDKYNGLEAHKSLLHSLCLCIASLFTFMNCLEQRRNSHGRCQPLRSIFVVQQHEELLPYSHIMLMVNLYYYDKNAFNNFGDFLKDFQSTRHNSKHENHQEEEGESSLLP